MAVSNHDPILTTDKLAAIRARAAAATAPEWGVTESGWIESDAGTLIAQAYAGSSERRRANGLFIAHARQDVPALLDMIDAITANYEELVQRVAQANDQAQIATLHKDEELEAAREKLRRACELIARQHNNPHCACEFCEELRTEYFDGYEIVNAAPRGASL